MTTRARLLAILKEPDRFGVPGWMQHADGMQHRKAFEKCADLNARHRLKRLCEEIAKVASDHEANDLDYALKYPDEARKMEERAHRAKTIARAILALGEPNEHS